MIMNNIGEKNCLQLRRTFNGSHPSSEIITSYEVPVPSIAPDLILPVRFLTFLILRESLSVKYF